MNFSALIGNPVGHSIGQDIYNSLFMDYGIDSMYIAIDLHRKNLPRFFDLSRGNIEGFNITAPYKEESIQFIDYADKIVSDTGSVNLVKNQGGKLYGYNSDYAGFMMLARKNNIDFSGKNVIIMGTGGAARTVAYSIMQNYNSNISIVSRNPGEKKIYGIATTGYNDIKEYDIIINCTPLGTFPDTGMPIPENMIHNGITGIDLVYNPSRTPFLKIVEKNGGIPVNGEDMFIGQGIETLKKIYGITVDYEKFYDIFHENLRSK
ncbi:MULTISPECIES: shikimate dehydrogenase family protein [Ferroplasma]|jgi:shikimate dehydrogenase|uniref:Shikimate 5-dehydrogenase n=2 Tax=Ferroplasma TaxID=74968 RepID=S0AP61_FERAC|nr:MULTISPECIES: shikimate dehydrogenase [Ferroplasma]AGO60691.1 shikimate 5-dehydrogenase [Ferroplasma acidarmanus Fer1]ARD85452.1 shikimate 5-dehydrogenase [Ferroplasma acidiphilum]MCL4349300.1 shikimate dehydrogenase [Candidatus Thermoplasmatota archaeon]NOL59535.1 shikimate dehydrogenase [Ferroplasma acidiphilum]